MAVTRMWKVYGREGHRQAMSFEPTVRYDWSTKDETRKVEFINSDETGTNEYTLVRITCDSAMACANEIDGQITDGYFEDVCVGGAEEVKVV